MSEVLITVEELNRRKEAGERTALLDVRWRLDLPDGSGVYAEGHIPGAVYVDLETELSAHGAPSDGRHPLPSTEALQAAARGWGLNDGDFVVTYDDFGGLSAARAWWMLRDAGVEVRILDGGLQAWIAAGGEPESDAVPVAPGGITLSQGAMPRLTIDEAAALPQTGLLVDVRLPERYRGEVEPIDPVAGHIPGARNLPTAGNVDADGRFLSIDRLRERFEAAGLGGAERIGVYCGSGVNASHAIAALTHAGYEASLYPGSWSQWCNTPGRPIETGEGAHA